MTVNHNSTSSFATINVIKNLLILSFVSCGANLLQHLKMQNYYAPLSQICTGTGMIFLPQVSLQIHYNGGLQSWNYYVSSYQVPVWV